MGKALGNLLTQLRAEKGVQQKVAAAAIGCGASTLAYWEMGDAQPRPSYIRNIAEYYGVPVETITKKIEHKRRTPKKDPDKNVEQEKKTEIELWQMLEDTEGQLKAVMDELEKVRAEKLELEKKYDQTAKELFVTRETMKNRTDSGEYDRLKKEYAKLEEKYNGALEKCEKSDDAVTTNLKVIKHYKSTIDRLYKLIGKQAADLAFYESTGGIGKVN